MIRIPPLKNIFHLAKNNIKPKGDEYLAERDVIERKMFPELSGHELNPDERPLYAAINTARYQGGAANRSYGTAVIVLNPEVARRATYIMDDSFFSTAVKIDDRRFSDFHSMLGNSALPRDLIARICTPNTPANRDFEDWLRGIANKQSPTVANLSALPESLGIAGEEQQTLFRSLLIECFGDAQGTRKIMATHDNLEALIPRMSGYDGNSLARAAIAAQEGDPRAVLTGAKYIEAHIQGPLVPSRDIAEIRIIRDFEDPLSREDMARIKGFERQTRIKVKILGSSNPQKTIGEKDAEEQEKVRTAQADFNLRHLNAGRIDKLTEDYTASFAAKCRVLIDSEPRFADVRPLLTFGGNAASGCINSFYEMVEERKSDPRMADDEPEAFVELAFKDTVTAFLTRKAELVRSLNNLQFETPAQKASFAKWVCEAGDLNSAEEAAIIHEFATKHARFLREVYSKNPPMDDSTMVMEMGEIVREASPRLEAFIASLNRADYGTDNRNKQLDRISFMSMTLLQNANPPMTDEQIKVIYDRINSPGMKTLRAQLFEIGNRREDRNLAEFPGAGMLRSLCTLWQLNAWNLGGTAGVNVHSSDELNGEPYSWPMSMLPNDVRLMAISFAPRMMTAFKSEHPEYETFPQASVPERLPIDDRGRRNFLIRHLNSYVNQERNHGFQHGRGHAVRSFIYGAVMCSMLEERGLKVDRNAVLCGIAMHDAGWQGDDNAPWQRAGADACVRAMTDDFGGYALGTNYVNAMRQCIEGTSDTLEAMIIQAAQSLDLDPEHFAFLPGRDGEIPTAAVLQLRQDLMAEADRLLQHTNPRRTRREDIESLERQMAENPGRAAALREQLSGVENDIQNDFQAESRETSRHLVERFESLVLNHPRMFPMLSRYYRT